MSKINILPDNVVSKIAAGEVVENPSSVVRELIDNSIDAGSNNIFVNVISGGKELIEVIDDGEGMDKDDLEKCYLRHTTSKIKDENDIYRIRSLGFRGEALASIAEVSELEIISKYLSSEDAYKLLVVGGVKKSLEPTAWHSGTKVRVKRLFFNLPARRSFLKSETTEFKNIYEVFVKKSLPFPNISFELRKDNKKYLALARTSNYETRIIDIFPEINDLMEITQSFDDFTLSIFHSKPSVNRPNRHMQFFFVNKRCVENKSFMMAVSRAYGSLVPKGSYPIVFCFLEIDPSLVDVNIHPAKTEVKFKNEGKIFYAISSLIEKNLRTIDQIPDIHEIDRFNPLEKEIKKSIENFLISKSKDVNYPKTIPNSSPSLYPDKQEGNVTYEKTPLERSINITRNSVSNYSISNYTEHGIENQVKRDNVVLSKNFLKLAEKYRFVGVVLGTYAIFEVIGEDKLLIMDQHAAHERIIFSRIYKKFNSTDKLESQLLLQSLEFEVSLAISETITNNLEIFEKLGFRLEILGNKVTIYGYPRFFDVSIDIKEAIIEISEKISQAKETPEKIVNAMEVISCREAVKANDKLSIAEYYQILEELQNIDEKYACPHGRPTMVYLSKDYLEKIFLRKT